MTSELKRHDHVITWCSTALGVTFAALAAITWPGAGEADFRAAAPWAFGTLAVLALFFAAFWRRHTRVFTSSVSVEELEREVDALSEPKVQRSARHA